MSTMWLPPASTLLSAPQQTMLQPQPSYLVSSDLLYSQKQQKARSKKVFTCPYPDCGQTSSNKGNLSKHIATRHEHRKDFACPIKGCSRRFAKKYNMLRHLSASGVHRDRVGLVKGKDRAKWTSMELDLASFLATQCGEGGG